nr:MAG TPA: Heterogeneous nuclear ribonucleoprotein [Caudoviricetes sp.]
MILFSLLGELNFSQFFCAIIKLWISRVRI